jgi:hypothetical protein
MKRVLNTDLETAANELRLVREAGADGPESPAWVRALVRVEDMLRKQLDKRRSQNRARKSRAKVRRAGNRQLSFELTDLARQMLADSR